MSTDQLTEREQQCLEHLRRAEELDVSLAEYARSFELDVKELYSAKQSLMRKGALVVRANGAETADVDPAQSGDFVPVQVTPRRAPSSGAALCRIHHPSGLMIECTSFPPAAWLATLLKAASDVPA